MKHKRSVMSVALATIMVVSLVAVYVSTSGSAATNTSMASVKATPDLVGSPIAAGTSPAACVFNGSDVMVIFVKGYDGALWYREWSLLTNRWGGAWISLGGRLTSSPAAVSRSSGSLDVYVRGTDGAVYEKAYDGKWHDWYKVGGQVAAGTGPGASGWTGREDVFVQGTDGALYQTTWTQASLKFSNWVNLGGKLTSSPCAVSRDLGVIDVYVAGTNGAIYGVWYLNGVWHSWYSLGGKVALGTGPAVCFYGTGREDVFVTGTNGALYQQTWDEPYGWISLGGKLTSSPTVATFTFAGTIDIEVFARGTTGLIDQKEYYGGSWYPWMSGVSAP